ncbi:MAG: hypothetical protein Tsb0027_15830 [Wenzhouxiangellaceae bacterium]
MEILVWLITYILTVSFSGVFVRTCFSMAKVSLDHNGERESVGKLIGKLENILVLTIVMAEAYTALALIFAAKNIVRLDKQDEKSINYYILGTLANFTWSLVMAMLAKFVIINLSASLPLNTITQHG